MYNIGGKNFKFNMIHFIVYFFNEYLSKNIIIVDIFIITINNLKIKQINNKNKFHSIIIL